MPGMLLLDPLTTRLLPCRAIDIFLDRVRSSQGAIQRCEFSVRPVTCTVCYKEEMQSTALFAILQCKATTQSVVWGFFPGLCFPSPK